MKRLNWCMMLRWLVYFTLFAILVLATIDTHIFVYPSFSRTLLPELGIMFMVIVALTECISGRNRFCVTKEEWFYMAWIVYIALHYALCNPHEQYRSSWFAVTLLVIPTISFFLREGTVCRKRCQDMLLAVAVIHIIYITMQWLGIADSTNKYFPLTGSNDNPTVTALYLAGCVPIMVARVVHSTRRTCYIILLLAVFIGIIALRCRTAYIGLFVEAAVFLSFHIRKKKIRLKSFTATVCVIIGALFVAVASIKLYNMKRDSADGRLLIWKLSTEMMAEHPQGYGYGLFEKEYNLRQAEYFRTSENATLTERRNADFVAMVYNDYLEHGVQGGAVGMLFLAAFYILALRKSVKQGQITEASIISAFAVMSTTNFVSTAIQPWLLLMSVTANVSAAHVSTLCESSCSKCRRYTAFIVLPLLSAITFQILSMTMAQARLKEKGAIAGISAPIGTSEAYWTRRAEGQMQSKEYSEALKSIHTARLYTSSISLFTMEYQCHSAMGQEPRGINLIDTLSYMIPSRLAPKYMLMRYYDRKGLHQYALAYAHDILQAESKVQNAESAFIINEARQYTERYEK